MYNVSLNKQSLYIVFHIFFSCCVGFRFAKVAVGWKPVCTQETLDDLSDPRVEILYRTEDPLQNRGSYIKQRIQYRTEDPI